MARVALVGGSGFIGQHLAHELQRREHRVKVLTRHRERAKNLILLPTVEVETCDVQDPAQLAAALAGSDAVVNLVGILHESRRAKFDQVHDALVAKLIDACRANGISRLLHVSALHAEPHAPSAYLRSKAEGERRVVEFGRAGGAVTVFRPSVVFGPGDSFLTLFARLVQALPVIALACPNARFQPIYVEDLAQAIAASVEDARSFGARYDMCGPKVYALKELVEFVAALLGKRRPIIGLSPRLSYLLAWLMEWSPVKLITRDNYRSMQVASVCDCPFPELFALTPTSLEAVAIDYLTGGSARRRYQLFRNRAGR